MRVKAIRLAVAAATFAASRAAQRGTLRSVERLKRFVPTLACG